MKEDEPQLKNNKKNAVYIVEVKHMKNSNVKKYTWSLLKILFINSINVKKDFGFANNKVLLIQFEITQKHTKNYIRIQIKCERCLKIQINDNNNYNKIIIISNTNKETYRKTNNYITISHNKHNITQQIQIYIYIYNK